MGRPTTLIPSRLAIRRRRQLRSRAKASDVASIASRSRTAWRWYSHSSPRITCRQGRARGPGGPGRHGARLPRHRHATNMSAKPAGGRGLLSRGWYFPDQCPAQLLAFVALDMDTAWRFTLNKARELAQQHSERGIRQLYWRLKADPARPKPLRHEAQMVDFLLPTRAAQLFPKWLRPESPLDLRHEHCNAACVKSGGVLLVSTPAK